MHFLPFYEAIYSNITDTNTIYKGKKIITVFQTPEFKKNLIQIILQKGCL